MPNSGMSVGATVEKDPQQIAPMSSHAIANALLCVRFCQLAFGSGYFLQASVHASIADIPFSVNCFE
jgi:hypothetical protein